MKIVLDLQGAQSDSQHRGIGRYSLSLALAIAKVGKNHEIIVVLNGLFPQSIDTVRKLFSDLIPQTNIKIFNAVGPVDALNEANDWRRHSAEILRENFIADLNPDIVHISSVVEGFGDNSVNSIGIFSGNYLTAATFYDVIPLIHKDAYLLPNSLLEKIYLEKISYFKNADILLAISNSSRQEAVDYLGVDPLKVRNISAATDPKFQPLHISEEDEKKIRSRFKLTRPFLMYSGATDERKNHLRLIKAFSILPKHYRDGYQLAIVGGMPGHHQSKFEEYSQFCGLSKSDVIFTGRVTDQEMIELYNLTDLFVFPSWHEGFGLPVLEAMSCGAPVIGANTTSVPEIIGDLDALFDPFNEKSIAAKIVLFLDRGKIRNVLNQKGLSRAKNFSWDASAKLALEAFSTAYDNRNILSGRNQTSFNTQQRFFDEIKKLPFNNVSDIDLANLATAFSRNSQQIGPKQFFVDISELIQHDAKTGIQRVVRNILLGLLESPPVGYIVKAIYSSALFSGYRYAKKYTASLLNLDIDDTHDNTIDFYPSDIFLGLDLDFSIKNVAHADFFFSLRQANVKILFVQYDLLPMIMPNMFPIGMAQEYMQWLEFIARADGIICISKTVAEEVLVCLDSISSERFIPLNIGWFQLGSDFEKSTPSTGLPINSTIILDKMKERKTFLMVGTIEPRKGHMQTLNAFEHLWDENVDVNLVIVGKQGWNVELIVELIRCHREYNKRLFWLNGISDEFLQTIYDTSDCLIAASEGEGFGLPLIEAGKNSLSIIARDIPVFREVAGENAFYFSAISGKDLAKSICQWIDLSNAEKEPKSENLAVVSWAYSTQMLLKVILSDVWSATWMPDVYRPKKYLGSDWRFDTQVGQRIGNNLHSRFESGYLMFGPYLSLPPGDYEASVSVSIGHGLATQAYADISINAGCDILTKIDLDSYPEGEALISLPIMLEDECKDLEIRIWVGDETDIVISKIIFNRSQKSV